MLCIMMTDLEKAIVAALGGAESDGGWCSISDVMRLVSPEWGRIPSRQGVQLSLERLHARGVLHKRESPVGVRGALRYWWRLPSE